MVMPHIYILIKETVYKAVYWMMRVGVRGVLKEKVRG